MRRSDKFVFGQAGKAVEQCSALRAATYYVLLYLIFIFFHFTRQKTSRFTLAVLENLANNLGNTSIVALGYNYAFT